MTSFITPYHSLAPRGSLTLLDPVPWVDRLFSDDWDSLFRTGLDYDEKTATYSTELDLAGYKREEVKVEVADGQVTVTVENPKRGKVVRSFYLSDVDPDKIGAKLDHGVLSITLPKRAEKLPKRVEIS